MKTPTTLLALSAALTACVVDTPSAGERCTPGELSAPRGLLVEAAVNRPSADEDAPPEYLLICGEVEITDRAQGWTWEGVTPAMLEVAPGNYDVSVSWQDEGVTYRYDDVISVRTRVHRTLPLCVDLTGTWSCTDGEEARTTEVRMYEGCFAHIEGEELMPHVSGHTIDGGRHFGEVASDGERFTYAAFETWTQEWTCDRVDE